MYSKHGYLILRFFLHLFIVAKVFFAITTIRFQEKHYLCTEMKTERSNQTPDAIPRISAHIGECDSACGVSTPSEARRVLPR